MLWDYFLFTTRLSQCFSRIFECPQEFVVAINEENVHKLGHGNSQGDVSMVGIQVIIHRRCNNKNSRSRNTSIRNR